MKKITVNLFKGILFIFCVILASLPIFYIAPFGADALDEPMQILNSVNPINTPLTPLSSYLGLLFGTTFGWEWLKYRFLAFGLHKLAIMIGCCYMWKYTKSYGICLAITFSVLLISSIFPVMQNIYGWDSWSLPFLVLTLVLLLENFKKERLLLIILSGITTALSGMCRLPNFIMLFFIAGILFFKDRQQGIRMPYKNILLYILVTIIVSVLLLIPVYNNPVTYLELVLHNNYTSHSPVQLITAYITSALGLMCFPAMLYCCYKATLWGRNKGTLAYGIIYIIDLLVLYYFCLINHGEGFSSVLKYIIAIEILLLATLFQKDKHLAITLILLGCVPFVGSNTGVTKFMSLPLFPILIALCRNSLDKNKFAFGGICILALTLYSYNGIRNSSFLDVGIKDADYTFTDGLAKGIKTSSDKGERIAAIVKDFENNSKGCRRIVLRHGGEYIYEYLLMASNAYLCNRFGGAEDDDPDYVTWTKTEIEKSGNKVAILRFCNDNETSLMSDVLDNLCTQVKVGDGYCIYVKKN